MTVKELIEKMGGVNYDNLIIMTYNKKGELTRGELHYFNNLNNKIVKKFNLTIRNTEIICEIVVE